MVGDDMTLFILCLKIFFARILDVSLGTLRTIITVKGKNFLAACIGFIEICIWFTIVREALNTDETSMFIMLSYAAGYATGTYIGGVISQKVIKGTVSVQIITSKNDLGNIIRQHGFAVSIMNIKGQEDTDKYMLYIEVNNKSYNQLMNVVKEFDDKAFIVVNETKFVQNGFIK